MALANPATPSPDVGPLSEAELMRRERAEAAQAASYAEAARRHNPDVPQIPPHLLPPGARAAQPQAPGAAASKGPLDPSSAFKPPPAKEQAESEYPAVVTMHAEWVSPSGESHAVDLPVRVLNRDDQIAIAAMVGRAASSAGARFDDLPVFDQEVMRAIATAEHLWPNMSAQFRAHVHNDDDFALDIATAVKRHRDTYFRRLDREGRATEVRSTVLLVPGGVAAAPSAK